jgi:hypothetical protein
MPTLRLAVATETQPFATIACIHQHRQCTATTVRRSTLCISHTRKGKGEEEEEEEEKEQQPQEEEVNFECGVRV